MCIRDRYNVTGLFENSPYDGVREMLETLRARGFILGVASSKPDGMVKRILEHFGLAKYFHEIVGSDPEKMKMSKACLLYTSFPPVAQRPVGSSGKGHEAFYGRGV